MGLDFLVLDEFADIDEEAWTEVLRPTLSDKQGGCLFIGTPKGRANWSYELFQLAELYPESWASFQYTTLDGGQVTEEEVQAAKRDLDERTFRQEYNATFETYGNVVAYAFDREQNIKELENPNLDELHIGLDFNTTPITAAVMVRHNDALYVIDEVYIKDSHTGELADEIRTRYPKSKIITYPDPAGRQRKTSANGATDFTILQNAGFTVKAPNSHNAVRDRINSTNARLCSASGERHLFISPKCKHVIESLEKFSYKEGTTVPNKDGNDHMFDALSYAVDYMYPIKRNTVFAEPKRFGHRLA